MTNPLPGIDALSIVRSPPANIRSRGLCAMENVRQKGSMACFVPTNAIIRYLAPNFNLKRTLQSSLAFSSHDMENMDIKKFKWEQKKTALIRSSTDNDILELFLDDH